MMKTLICIFLISALISALILPMTASAAEAGLRIEFLNIGKADAILIREGSHTIVIDAGKNGDGKKVVKRLKALGCESVDLMIITHFDKDHVGGADKIIKAMPVGLVFIPAYEKDSKQAADFHNAVDEYSIPCERIKENRSLTIGNLQLTIDVANESDYGENEENDFSLVTGMQYGKNSFLFTGDAENPRLAELLEEGIGHFDVLKVPHHGRREKLSSTFFDAVSPVHAVITSGEDEDREETSVVKALERAGARVWLTRNGNVVCTSDGTSINVFQEQ